MKTKHPRQRDFLRALANLLEQYGATIQFNVGEGSDTYGLHGERLSFQLDEDVKPGERYPRSVEVASVDGWHVNAKRLREEL